LNLFEKDTYDGKRLWGILQVSSTVTSTAPHQSPLQLSIGVKQPGDQNHKHLALLHITGDGFHLEAKQKSQGGDVDQTEMGYTYGRGSQPESSIILGF